jgi:uncharacterized linocin/CFP29 family protein
MKFAAVNTGGCVFSRRNRWPVWALEFVVQPLVELRAPFVLPLMGSIWRRIERRARARREVAEKAARAEDEAIFNGYADAGIEGSFRPLSGRADTASVEITPRDRRGARALARLRNQWAVCPRSGADDVQGDFAGERRWLSDSEAH